MCDGLLCWFTDLWAQFMECVGIGRDLVRLLQSVARLIEVRM